MINKLARMNLHIHSTYSDGNSNISQIIKKVSNLNLDFIAITDHFSDSWKKNIIPTLDSKDKIDSYLRDISDAQNQLEKLDNNLIVLKGIEIDLGSSLKYINRLIDPSHFDLILFEYLETPQSIGFVKNILNNWKRRRGSKIQPLLGLAHFDPSNFIYGDLNLLTGFLNDFQVYFEFNSRYSQFYSVKYERFFKKLSQYKIPVAVGCDSHTLNRLNEVSEPLEMIEYYNLTKNYSYLIERLNNTKKNFSG
ncbi:MAG: PHP domain-containing protein [Candidatus Lokiarchaeota archaeon]|nr:PHP domain-containing protein [Candidatus Lokiarchaeota archaeon]